MTETTRPTTTAGELHTGQHFLRRVGAAVVEDVVVRVEHVLPYVAPQDEVPMVALTVTPIGGGLPFLLNWSASAEVRLATDAELAAVHETAARDELHADLAALQALIDSVAPRLRPYGRDVSFNVADGEVERIAAALSQPTRQFGNNGHIGVAWTAPGSDDRGPRLKVEFWGRTAPKPAADDLCADPWHEQPTEPTEACPACGDQPPAAPELADDPDCLACRHATGQHVEDHLGCRVEGCGCPFAQPAKTGE
ncbi:hypothetical protein GA0070616_4408 [Micromonospora nigra]|uniref:Uncharacterized protein n=1 Tax=Micromonospora nigra TaxID=145857 RepID=A0A1C6SS81_9ACTN|nr:hypothetical protein [Micromonospora nigra]SCL32212.1 hypothetical protein GA0070616_4408 [Micromonospora nigra]